MHTLLRSPPLFLACILTFVCSFKMANPVALPQEDYLAAIDPQDDDVEGLARVRRDSSDYYYTRTTYSYDPTMTIIIVVVAVIIKICIVICICMCMKRRRERAIRLHQLQQQSFASGQNGNVIYTTGPGIQTTTVSSGYVYTYAGATTPSTNYSSYPYAQQTATPAYPPMTQPQVYPPQVQFAPIAQSTVVQLAGKEQQPANAPPSYVEATKT